METEYGFHRFELGPSFERKRGPVVRRIARVSALCVCFVLNACGPDEPEPAIDPKAQAFYSVVRESLSVAEKPASGLAITLSAAGNPRRDRVVVRATVTNTCDRPLAWDRDFSVHVGWYVTDGTGAAIPRYQQESLSAPSPSELSSRFVILKPGQSFSKEIDLAGRVQESQEGHGTRVSTETGREGVFYHVGIFYETSSKLNIPATCKQINVRLNYYPHNLAFGGSRELVWESQS